MSVVAVVGKFITTGASMRILPLCFLESMYGDSIKLKEELKKIVHIETLEYRFFLSASFL